MPTRRTTKEKAKEAIREAYGNSEYTEEIIKALEQEPFINKACVSSNVCKHDKAVALEKIKTEIEQIELLARYTRGDIKQMAIDIIDKYKAESEEKE